jgi:hypothetical protein
MNKTRILTVLVVATFLLTLTASRVLADQTYSFHVTNTSGIPISSATVYLIVYQGSVNIPFNGVATDSNGNAVLTVPSGQTVSSWTVEAGGYVTQLGNNPSTSMNIQLTSVGSSSPNPTPGPNPPSNAPGLNDHGINWNVNPKDVEMWILFLFVVVIIAVLIGRNKGKKKEK